MQKRLWRLLLFGRRHGDAHPLARIAGEVGEHRLDQIGNDLRQVVVARLRLRMAFEQSIAIGGAADLQVEVAGVDGEAFDVVIAPARTEACLLYTSRCV